MNFQEQIDQLTQQIAQDPDNDEAYFKRGELYFRQKNYEQASRDYEMATKVNPEYSLAMIALGHTQALLEKRQEAGALLSTAQNMYPDHHSEYDHLGTIIDYTFDIFQDEPTAYLYNIRGIKISDFGLNWHAVVDYTLAVAQDSEYLHAFYNRGLAYNELEEYELAIVDFTRAIELEPTDPWCYNDRGNSYHSLKQYDLAIADYKKGLEQDSEIDALYNNIADVYFLLEEFDLAIQYFEEALQRNPLEPAYLTNLAELYLCMHNYAKADQMLAQYDQEINDSEYQLAANILKLIIKTILQQETTALKNILTKAQQLNQETHWNFDNLWRWWEKNQALPQEIKGQIKKYIDIAIGLD